MGVWRPGRGARPLPGSRPASPPARLTLPPCPHCGGGRLFLDEDSLAWNDRYTCVNCARSFRLVDGVLLRG